MLGNSVISILCLNGHKRQVLLTKSVSFQKESAVVKLCGDCARSEAGL
jgi:hypothetical protein